MDIRIIKTDEQHRQALEEVARLAVKDPAPETAEGARLELLAKLVDDYEKARFVFSKPDPIDAIVFRMQEMGLRQKDIADLLGGRNRASEVLSRKRALTLPMIRALHEKLDIPPALLVQEPKAEYAVSAAESALPRQTQVFGSAHRANLLRIQQWLASIRQSADARADLQGRFRKAHLSVETLRYVSRLSWMPEGPRLAMGFLAERGIALVIEPHPSSTRLDGAALIGRAGAPVIGLTLRQDRLDHFWFTLVHELVHAWKHLDLATHRAIADENLERRAGDADAVEREANELAAEILIDKAAWRRSEARLRPSEESIRDFATRMQVSPAIVAGRVRRERGDYTLFARLVGHRKVRAMFPEVKWS
jgi:HTH-type transcriptional regulator/antitoxin HigA